MNELIIGNEDFEDSKTLQPYLKDFCIELSNKWNPIICRYYTQSSYCPGYSNNRLLDISIDPYYDKFMDDLDTIIDNSKNGKYLEQHNVVIMSHFIDIDYVIMYDEIV